LYIEHWKETPYGKPEVAKTKTEKDSNKKSPKPMKHEETSWKCPTFNSNRTGYLQTNMVLFPSNAGSANTFR